MPLPLRSVWISDFRQLEGPWRFPLDAPIVLMHGPNGAGKTSVLSAIELALTGDIRSMRRHDDRYTAHLPTHGQDFATVAIEVADRHGTVHSPGRMTVGGARIEGAPALDPDVAQFYAERSYLDQVSLGQLLDLYQYREGKEESALARFVNELLGLDQLDALRSGLADTTDVRRLKNLSDPFASAKAEAEQAAAALTKASAELKAAEAELVRLHEELRPVAGQLGQEASRSQDETGVDVEEIESFLDRETGVRRGPRELTRSLTGLGGQIRSLLSRPATMRLDEARIAAAAAAQAYQEWLDTYEAPVAALQADAAQLDLDGDGALGNRLDTELASIDAQLARHEDAVSDVTGATALLAELTAKLDALLERIAQVEREAGSLASSLAALREHIVDDICPVCDRDFTEVSGDHLASHLQAKIAQISDRGRELEELQSQRYETVPDLHQAVRSLRAIEANVLAEDQLNAVSSRRRGVAMLRSRFDELTEPIRTGQDLARIRRDIERDVADLDALQTEEATVRATLSDHASALGVPAPPPDASLDQTWRDLSDLAAQSDAKERARIEALSEAHRLIKAISDAQQAVETLQRSVTDVASRKLDWDERMTEAGRRRAVARSVHTAASTTRTQIVQRVFTESLNDVWADVFSRLAPREPFIPAFGIPTSTKTALKLRLETIHPSGDPGGPPTLMLSAGNLNTAALSLFIALHLAVDPLIPCMVFDDPVQSMDEVHIAQFASLLRVLSKQHERQVIVAVHERELFDYLALELSPAYEGDELITIELGPDKGRGSDDGISRVEWSPDPAIAV